MVETKWFQLNVCHLHNSFTLYLLKYLQLLLRCETTWYYILVENHPWMLQAIPTGCATLTTNKCEAHNIAFIVCNMILLNKLILLERRNNILPFKFRVTFEFMRDNAKRVILTIIRKLMTRIDVFHSWKVVQAVGVSDFAFWLVLLCVFVTFSSDRK